MYHQVTTKARTTYRDMDANGFERVMGKAPSPEFRRWLDAPRDQRGALMEAWSKAEAQRLGVPWED